MPPAAGGVGNGLAQRGPGVEVHGPREVGQAVGSGPVGWLYGFGRYASYAGFVVLVGGAAFVLACWQRGSGVRALQRLVVSGWVTLTASTLALLLLSGLGFFAR